MLESLKAIDPGIISEVARRCLGLPAFVLQDWSVTPVRHEKVIETTGGLYRFYGNGLDEGEPKAWSAVLKIVNQPEDGCLDAHELCYWKRELLAYQAGLLSNLPGGIRAPRCFGVDLHVRDGWIWLEDIQEAAGSTWTLEHFQKAARHLGLFAGAYLTGQPMPRVPWLCGSLFRSLYADDGWWTKFMNPAARDNAWQRALVQAVFSEQLQAKVLQIWAEKWAWIAANERLPQVFCHNDTHRRNLILRNLENNGEELVAIDWAFCGPGGLGNDLGELIGTSLSYFAIDPKEANELEAIVLEGYLEGLGQAGWAGDRRLARAGYRIALALYWGGTLACEVALAQPEAKRVNVEAKYGRSLEAILPGWRRLAEFALDRADEARYWIRKMKND